MSYYTYFLDEKSTNNIIFDCSSSGFGGILIKDTPELEKQRRLYKLESEKQHRYVKFSDFYLNKIAWSKTKEEWLHRYMKYVPFKVDENGMIICEPIISVKNLEEPYMLTIDNYRHDYVDIYAFDLNNQDKFELHKKIWLEAKDYAYKMADIIFKNLEE